jgi:hypothetical protein
MKKSASSRSTARKARVSNGSITDDKGNTIAAAEFDRKFDAGEDITAYLDLETATRPNRAIQRVNVDFPTALLAAIDAEATRLGVTRQAFIKIRIADTLPRKEEPER